MLQGILIVTQSATADAGSIADRLGLANYFAASNNNAAFPVRDKNNLLAILLVDFESGKLRKLSLRGSDLLSPFLSQDGERLLFVRHPRDQVGRELVSCDTARLACISVLKSNGLISFPVKISNERILYVSSPYFKGADGRGRYNMKDLWVLSPDKTTRKLTDMRLYDLSTISVSETSVYFSAIGPPRDNSVIPQFDASKKVRSDIFKLPFNLEQATIGGVSKPLAPLFAEDGISISPSVSFDDSTVAFLRTKNDVGNYHYDLVVTNQKDQTTRFISSNGLGFSRPVVVGRTVYVNTIYHDRFAIDIVSPDEKKPKRLAEVLDTAINSTDAIDVNLK